MESKTLTLLICVEHLEILNSQFFWVLFRWLSEWDGMKLSKFQHLQDWIRSIGKKLEYP